MTDPDELPPVLAAHRWRDNGEMIAALHRLDIIRDVRTLDPTYGRGVWWRHWRPTDLTVIGMEPGHECGIAANFLQLPFADNTFAQAAWDPPYVAKGGRETSTMTDHQDRYGLTRGPKNPAEALTLWVDGLVEVARVVEPGGLIFAKAQNAISSAAQHWTAEDASLAARSMGLGKVGQLVYVNNGSAQDKGRTKKCPTCRGEVPEVCSGGCHGTGRIPSVQRNPRNNYSLLMLFRVPKVVASPVRDPLARIAELEAEPVLPEVEEVPAVTPMAYDPTEVNLTGLLVGACRDRLAELPDNSVHSVVTDPPYGLGKEPDITEVLTHWMAGDDYEHSGGGFMGKTWDGYVPGPATWREVFRVLKPGGHALVFAGSRTQDMMALSLRMAGFEIRDGLQWLYGSGFPKGQNVGKAVDKAAGAKREVVDRIPDRWTQAGGVLNYANDRPQGEVAVLGGPATPEAEQWEGWNSALKPAYEPIIVARKPFKGTLVKNVLEHGVGAYNVDACRVEGIYGDSAAQETHQTAGQALGRWPPNVLLGHAESCVQVGDAICECAEDCPVRLLDEQAGVRTSGKAVIGAGSGPSRDQTVYSGPAGGKVTSCYADTGGASRFFPQFETRFMYAPKAAKSERNAGMPEGSKNSHPTVKPLSVMRWLVKLVTPPGGVVLDPFLGSGTTAIAAIQEGFDWIGCERDAEYVPIIEARVAWAEGER